MAKEQVVDVRSSVAQALADFLSEWNALPPLIRSGCAVSMLADARRESGSSRVWSERALLDGLERRSRVFDGFHLAHEAWRRLLVALVRDADAEAERRGIDSDVAPEVTLAT